MERCAKGEITEGTRERGEAATGGEGLSLEQAQKEDCKTKEEKAVGKTATEKKM
jgi:hypothetical protein